MSNLNQFFGGSLWTSPMIHVQDKKTGDLDGGYMDSANTQYVRDINNINYNTISGCTLTNDGTTSGSTGTVGTQTIVNNPSTGVHNTLSSISIPAGTYVYALSTSTPAGVNNTASLIYDKTAGSDLIQQSSYISSDEETGVYEGIFVVSVTTSIDIRTSSGTVTTPGTDNMGNGGSRTSAVNVVHTDLKLFKVA